MYLTEKINGFANMLLIGFAVLFIAMQITLFVSGLPIKRSLTWLSERILPLKAEKV
ncbi:MAG: hypothetical protein M1322_01915 [Candidatus Parvarchaeota archaeon]|jgi:uncharacterized MAPEG superfamily protein|nr:hypothetical protein [Candidatus Parvarchaeota archaeon]MCL5106853.1 hypothetical protein [Candidatus Parvarchaeota archaeon]